MARTVSFTAPRMGPILVVDDYEDARLTVREALEDAGYGVIEARNGQEALSFLINRPDEHVSLILLDLQMPVMDGWALLEVLRCYVAWSKIPVIIVSAQEAHLERTLHRGVRGCIRAPYGVNDLIHRVDECMSGSRSTTLEHHDPGERTG